MTIGEAEIAALFPFIDNLSILMFTVASDLGEVPRERLASSLSLQGVNGY